MQFGSIARRYARALLELAKEEALVEKVLKDLNDFESLLDEQPSIRDVLTRRSFTSLQQVGVLRELLALTDFAPLTRNFLLLLVEKHRMNALDGIVREFKRGYDDLKGLVRVSVTSASPLPSRLEQQLIAYLESATKRRVILTKEVDPDIIGGVVTRVGDVLFDGSLSTQLKRMKSELLGGNAA